MASIQLSIADPCAENWNNMLPEEKGRFCLSCQKTVVDFTSMSDGQVFDYFKNYKGNTCGQFTPQQLDRDIAKPKTHSIGRWKFFWQILLPAVFAFHKGEAQTLKGKVAPKTVCKADTVTPARIIMGKIAIPSIHIAPSYKLQGTVVNEKEEPIPFATIISESGKGTMADGAGRFSIEILPGKNLVFSSVGYENKSFSYDSIKPATIKHQEVNKGTNTILIETAIQLKPAAISPDEIVVVCYGTTSKRTVMGSMSRISVTTLYQQTTRPVTDLPAIKIFPNPIQPGQSFQVSVQTKKTGNYILKIADATGKMMIEKKISITSKSQTETISGSALQQAGIYFLEVNNPANKKETALTGKLVVQ